jgi:hypothetical protein
MISESQIAQFKNGTPIFKEALATSTTVAYGKDVFYPGEVVRLLATADVDVKLCKEYLYGSEFGRSWHEMATSFWATDAEGSELGNVNNMTEGMADSSNVTLDKTRGTLSYSHVLEYELDDQDDVSRYMLLPPGRGDRKGRGSPLMLPAEVITVSFNHLESDVLKPLEWQLREERRPNVVGGAAQAYYYGTSAGTFGAAEVWNTLTASATEALVHFTVTVADAGNWDDAGIAFYTLALRPAENYVAETSHISHMGVHETVASASANRLSQDVEYFFVVNHRCRIGADMAAGTGTLYISKMSVGSIG